jgi:hypothetical protein
MPYLAKKINCRSSVALAIGVVGSGSIARSQHFDTTHRVKKSSNKGCSSILHILGNFSQGLSKFNKVSAPTFEAIRSVV